MEYLKGMPVELMIPRMINWVLGCEIRRSKSRNINGNTTRQMRECLMKLYCAIGELQRQKDNTETAKLKDQVKEMEDNMQTLREENIGLRKELENIKREANCQ